MSGNTPFSPEFFRLKSYPLKATYKTVAWFAAAPLLVALGVVLSFRSFRQIGKAAEDRAHTYVVITKANELLSELKDAETGQRGYLLTGDEAFLEPYLTVRNGIGSHLEELSRITLISAARKHLDAIRPLMDAKLAELSQVIELCRNHDMAAALAIVRSGRGMRLMDSIRSEMMSFIQLEASERAQRDARFQSDMRHMYGLIVAASLSAVLLALAFACLIYREAKQRLKNLVHLETQHLLEAQEATNKQLQQANATLQISEENLAVTLNSIGDAVIATDAEGRVTRLNPLGERLTGWTQAQATGRPVEEIFHIINQETRNPSVIPIKETLTHGTIHGLANHTILIARGGSECAIADSCAPIRDRDGQVVGAVLVFRDITKAYEADQALRDKAALIQTILNTVVDGIITVRASSGVIETANRAAERMFGYSAAELIGQDFSLLIPELKRDQCTVSLEDFNASNEAAAHGLGREVMGRRKDGGIFPMAIAASEMWLGGQRYFTGILRDVTSRKHAEEALLQAGPLQSAIFNSANFSSIATDAKGVIQIFNVGAERMLGYTAADVVNKITPADISDPQEVIARAKALSVELATPIAPGFEALVFKASRGIEDIYELTYIRKDGSRFPAVVSVTALRDAQNAIIGYLLIGTDNTARKQAEEALLKAGALQSAIFNSANFSSIATDAKGVIQIFNVGAERMLGYTAADVVNKITPADISDPQEVIARAKALSVELGTPIAPGFEALVFKASRGIEDIYELTYIRKDGSRLPAVVSVTALRDAQNAIIGYLLIGTDNTARKQIEEERKQLDQRLRDHQFYTRSLFESNTDALMTTDLSGIITDVNKQMEALTGCTRDELIGAPLKNYFTDPERAEAGIKLVLSERKVTDCELTARARDGKETIVSYNATTFYDRDRRLQGVFVAARDITERKRLDQVLQEKNAELDQAGRLKDEFLANMSHELRTPLNAILGLSEALLENAADTLAPRQVKSITTISTSGAHLLALINDILDLSKIEAGKLELNLGTVNVQEFCESCLVFVRTQAMQKNIGVAFEHDGRVAKLSADPKYLKQILVNLLTNAVKFTPDGGHMGLTVAAPEGEGVVRFTVWDTGIGIAPENAGKLFHAFTQIDSGLTRAQEGTGLGLALVAKLAELHGGSVALESGPGRGSRFIVTLPQILATAPALKAALHDEPDRRNYRRALVIEDDPTSGAILVNYLTELGLDSVLRVRGEASVEAVLRERPDVILLDIMLPGENGWVVLNKLKKHPGTRDIPVVVVSVVDEPQKSHSLGAEAHFTKPVTRTQIAGFLQRAVPTRVTPAPPCAPLPSAGPSILLAEDNKANVQTIGDYLEDKGYMMHYATNGLVAVKSAREIRPALILMDIQMPVMDGLAAIQEIRADATTKNIPIVALTALVMPGDRERCLAAGATDYMSKPVSLKELAALVARLLRGERSA
jgi:PAS domain S-box-containing protein